MSTAEVLGADAFELGDATPARAAAAADPESLDLKQNVERLERQLITTALARTGGNRAHAARLLGIRRALLYARMLQLGLGSGD
jgi:two-component system, NtrC family, response regulator